MYSTLLAPTEKPVSSLDIKRALLTFDKVLVPDPDDRELFPPQALFNAIGGIPFFGSSSFIIRPLPKLPGYDEEFTRLMDEIEFARREGLIDVVSAFNRPAEPQFTIGGIDTGGYPLNEQFVLSAYRNLARDNGALRAAISSDRELYALPTDEVLRLGEVVGQADGAINNDPALPLLSGVMMNEVHRTAYTVIARSRLASVIKTVGFCATKELVPTFSHPSYINALSNIQQKANDVIDHVAEFDDLWALRNRLMNVAHREYVDDAVLAQMPIDEVVRLRTVAWGRQAEARDAMLQSVAQLAKELENETDFERAATDRIAQYRESLDDVVSERSDLKYTVICALAERALDFGQDLLPSTASGVKASLAQVQNAVSAGTLILAGCAMASALAPNFRQFARFLRESEAKYSDNACVGLHRFYGNFA